VVPAAGVGAARALLGAGSDALARLATAGAPGVAGAAGGAAVGLEVAQALPADVDNLVSGSSDFSKSSLNIRKFTVHILLKPGLDLDHSDMT